MTPDQGDIVWLEFNPSAGIEISKTRPAFVISRAVFNEHTGMAIFAPITSTKRGIKLEVELSDTQTQGAVLVHQLKSLDFSERKVEFIEHAPSAITERVVRIAKLILS